MQIILDHIDAVVRLALRRYMDAENALTASIESQDADAINAARQNGILAARQATDVLHHLSDFVFKEPSSALSFPRIEDVRGAVDAKCVFLRTTNHVGDVGLLRDIADAFKHHRPDRPSASVSVSSDIVTIGTGYGQMRWGEGKYGSAEQVVVSTRSGDKRALSSILQNVFDAWMIVLARPLASISTY
jgi:hypothetical protein